MRTCGGDGAGGDGGGGTGRSAQNVITAGGGDGGGGGASCLVASLDLGPGGPRRSSALPLTVLPVLGEEGVLLKTV